MNNSFSQIQKLVQDISGMSLDPSSPSNNSNALDYTSPAKKDYNTIEFTNKENRQINEMVTLSLDTIQVSNVAERTTKVKPVD